MIRSGVFGGRGAASVSYRWGLAGAALSVVRSCAGRLRAESRGNTRDAGRGGPADAGCRPTGCRIRRIEAASFTTTDALSPAAAQMAAAGRAAGGDPGAARVQRLQQRLRRAGQDLGGARHRHLCLRPARLRRRAGPRPVARKRGARHRCGHRGGAAAPDVSRQAALSARRKHGRRGGDPRRERRHRHPPGAGRRRHPVGAGGVDARVDAVPAAHRAVGRGAGCFPAGF